MQIHTSDSQSTDSNEEDEDGDDEDEKTVHCNTPKKILEVMNSNIARNNDGTISMTEATYNSITNLVEKIGSMQKQIDDQNELLKQFNSKLSKEKNSTHADTKTNSTIINDKMDTENNEFPPLTKTNNAQNTPFKKNKRVPPIFVNSENYDQHTLLNMIKPTGVDVNTLKFFPSANKQTRIQFADLISYDIVHSMLRNNEVSLHTHAVKERIKPVFVIKNLCKNFPLEEIKNDLKEQNFEVIEISRFESKYHTENNIDSKMVKVVLPEGTDTKAFIKIQFILHMRVYIQALRPAKILQCKRCQRTAHSANYCTNPYRCVKCVENHAPGECKLNAPGNTLKPKCCNCGGEHIASNYSCPYLKKAIEKKDVKKSQDNTKIFMNPMIQQQKNVRNTTQKIPMASSTSYASAIKKNNSDNNSKSNVLIHLKNCMLAMQQTIEMLINNNK